MRQVLAQIANRTFRSCKSTLAIAVAVTALAAAPVQANEKYAAIVVDANSGKTLFSSSADEARFPASLTKMMTLYLTFEALQAGRITTSTKVPFSKNAANEPPTKLGVRAGGSITVESAILSLVTKSANDSATALAELLGGSEAEFAKKMTVKARTLGMSSTTFRNAHGLPNPQQRSTARDLAVLGIALREHYPQYYDYFSTRNFKFGKQNLRNHNRLLGKVKGVDGIKTGYTNASGFNLVSSVQDGNRSIVAVVMGGRTGASRDAHMAELIKTWLPKATNRRGGDLVAKGPNTSSPIKALTALLPTRNPPKPIARPEEPVPFATAEDVASVDVAEETAGEAIGEGSIEEPDAPFAYAEPIPARMGDIDPIKTASVPSGAWVIQVASSPSQVEAQEFLTRTNKRAGKLLASAEGFTTPFAKDGVTYYRARYSGFDNQNAARKACTALKRQKIDCYAVQQ